MISGSVMEAHVLHALRARLTPLGADRHTCGAGTMSYVSDLPSASLVPGWKGA